MIENTNLASVYLFEQEQAATISVGNHYLFALEDSDICIFLIDNADGVTPSVQAEIDRVRKNHIQSLYYFCDEKSTEKTTLEESLMGAQFAKSKTVHKFEDLGHDGAQGLIDDIISVYHHYCKGRLQMRSGTEEEEMQKIRLSALEENLVPVVPKSVLENVSQCRKYLMKLTDAWFWEDPAQAQMEHSDMDDWCANFLPILFEGKSIRGFNTGINLMF